MSGSLQLVEFTHDQLVEIAAKWLRKKHHTIITEMVTGAGEVPDAIGWGSVNQSTLIECKISRSDFRADAKKFFRRYPENGMGQKRYYMAAAGVLDAADMLAGWGLLEVKPNGKVRAVVKPEKQPANIDKERCVLLSALRRIGNAGNVGGVSIKRYTFTTKGIATFGVVAETSEAQA